MYAKKYVFNDLDDFVNRRILELRDYEQQFFNQMNYISEMVDWAANSKVKLDWLYNRLMNLKAVQDTIDNTLGSVQTCQTKWDQILKSFENKCPCNEVIDETRCSTYKLADKLFTTFYYYKEMLDNIESQAMVYKDAQREEPIYLLFQVMNMNLNMLDKLNTHIEKVKNRLELNEQIWHEYKKYFNK